MPTPRLSKKELENLLADGLGAAEDALEQGDLVAAEELCQEVLGAAPADPRAVALLGVIAWHQGDSDSGSRLLAEAIARDPKQASRAFAFGEELCRDGYLDDGAELLRLGLRGQPESSGAWLNLGRAQSGMDDHLGAVQSYTQALKHDPKNTPAQLNLGAAFGELGRAEEAEGCFRAVLSIDRDFSQARANLGNALTAQSRYAEAAVEFRQVIQEQPELARAHADLALCLLETPDGEGHRAEILRLLAHSVTLDPQHAQLQFEFGSALLRLGEPLRALELARGFLALYPHDSGLRAIECSALAQLERTAELTVLRDFTSLVYCSELAPPAGFLDLAAFNAALSRHVETHPTLAWSKARHGSPTTRHSGSLMVSPLGPIEALQAVIEETLDRYVAQGKQSGNPLFASPPEETFLNLWGVVMHNGGHQTPHVHPAAWLSGCYFAAVPSTLSETSHEGFLEFCAGRSAEVTAQGLFSVKPRAGLLVVFPSHLYHYTVPLSGTPGTDPLVCVSFDLLATVE